MKKLTLLIAIAFLFAGSNLTAQDMELDEVLDNYFETMGQKKLLKTKTISMKGKSSMMGMEFTFKLLQKRPDKFCMEIDVQGAIIKQVYDGKTGWMINPMMGSMEPVDLAGPELKGMKEQADIDGYLWNWKDRGFQCELVGKEDMEGTEVYNVKLTKEEGDVDNYYIDAENFVVLKLKNTVFVQGSEQEQENYMSNYKPIDGTLVPHTLETRMNGTVQATITIEEILYNEDIDDSTFEKPSSGQE